VLDIHPTHAFEGGTGQSDHGEAGAEVSAPTTSHRLDLDFRAKRQCICLKGEPGWGAAVLGTTSGGFRHGCGEPPLRLREDEL
jgi:hypothetical protein